MIPFMKKDISDCLIEIIFVTDILPWTTEGAYLLLQSVLHNLTVVVGDVHPTSP